MNHRARAIALLVIQCLLVGTIASKYWYERATQPRVWVRVAQYDPELPMRGRYLALSPLVDACSLLPKNPPGAAPTPVGHFWQVRTVARDGNLAVEDAAHQMPRSDFQRIALNASAPCNRAQLWPGLDLFVPETAQSPFPLKPGQELWVEVTVPPHGPPRAIQLALSGNGKWQPLQFN